MDDKLNELISQGLIILDHILITQDLDPDQKKKILKVRGNILEYLGQVDPQAQDQADPEVGGLSCEGCPWWNPEGPRFCGLVPGEFCPYGDLGA